MKPNLADRTCELLKWVCNYRKLHNKTTREQLRQYSLLLLSLLNVSKAMWLMFTHLWGGGGQSDFATTDWLKHSLNNPALHPTLTSSAVYKVIIDNIHTWTKHTEHCFPCCTKFHQYFASYRSYQTPFAIQSSWLDCIIIIKQFVIILLTITVILRCHAKSNFQCKTKYSKWRLENFQQNRTVRYKNCIIYSYTRHCHSH